MSDESIAPATTGLPALPGRRFGKAMAWVGGLILFVSLVKVRYTITSVLGAMAAVGIDVARDKVQTNAFFHQAFVNATIGVVPGLVGLFLLSYGVIPPGSRWRWAIIVFLAACLAILPYAVLDHLKRWVESV